MSKTLKKTLSIILTILMIVSAIPVAFAAETVSSGYCGASTNVGGEESVTWTLDSDGLLTISGEGDMADYGYGESPFFCNTVIKTVVIKDGVTSIGGYAFGGSSLKNVTIPNSVTSIGDKAFRYCTSLASIEIPDSVTSIGDSVFEACESLANIKIGNSVTSIGDYAFSTCTSLESIKIPSSVTSIGGSAFFYCTSLASIEIPDSVTSIGVEAFSCCISLKNVTIPKGVTSIGNRAFYCCPSLTLVYYLGTSEQWNEIEIGSMDNDALTNATRHYCTEKEAIDATCTEAGYTAGWYCADCEEYVVGHEETAALGHIFEDGACKACGITGGYCGASTNDGGEESVTWTLDSEGLLTISGTGDMADYRYGKSPFYQNSDIKTVVIKKGVTSIGNNAFFACTSLASIEIPESVTRIGSRAIESCKSLASIEIPDSVTSIGDLAFQGCYNLASVTIGNSVTSIGNWAFNVCSSLESVTVNEGNESYSSENGVLFN